MTRTGRALGPASREKWLVFLTKSTRRLAIVLSLCNFVKVHERKIPVVGYDGYIRGYKPENMFGKSY